MKIAVLITAFNRREITLACLRRLTEQKLPESWQIDVFLTDDASSDGTAEAVKETFPEVHLLHGTGDLFWNGGMRMAWSEALKHGADYYLLLNDDTTLTDTAIADIVASHRQYREEQGKEAICVGSCQDPETGKITYGGRNLYSWVRPKSYLVEPNSRYQACDMANANILLVPAAIVQQIGILSKDFTHGLGDFDYSLRSRKAGFGLIVAPGFLGVCENDHIKKKKSSPKAFSEKVNMLTSVRGINYVEYLTFIRRHFPVNLPEASLKLLIKAFFPDNYDKVKEGLGKRKVKTSSH